MEINVLMIYLTYKMVPTKIDVKVNRNKEIQKILNLQNNFLTKQFNCLTTLYVKLASWNTNCDSHCQLHQMCFYCTQKSLGDNNSQAEHQRYWVKITMTYQKVMQILASLLSTLKATFGFFYTFKEITETEANYMQNMVG